MKVEYLDRVYDVLLRDALETTGAVVVQGAKWCGKTRLCEQVAKSAVYLHDPDRAEAYLALAESKPSRLLEGATPRLIDEWQDAPQLWNAVRYTVDQRGGEGHFILTGSAVPPQEGEKDKDQKKPIVRRHTGTGRFTWLTMRPMTLWESRESTGEVSLAELFAGHLDVSGESRLGDEDLAYAICRGGWPEAVTARHGRAALRKAKSYLDAVVEEDIHRVDGVEKNPQRVRALLRSLARNVSTLATGETIMADVRANDSTISDKTLAAYLNALRRIFVVEDIPAWSPNLRSRSAIRTSSKRQFADPSIAAAALGVTPEKLMLDFRTFGFLLESLAARDLRVYVDALGGTVRHYHDESGLESDFIIDLDDGRWAAVEVKKGVHDIDEGAGNLNALAKTVDTGRMGEPVFKLVLTGTPFAYTRPDGVIVCPLGCLRP